MNINKRIKCKLTTQSMTTYDNFQWKLGERVTIDSEIKGKKPCTNQVLHYYEHPILAVLFNQTHANITNPRLFAISTSPRLGTDGLKSWCKSQVLLEEIELPKISITTKIAFTLICILYAYKEETWQLWATNWLTGKDRSCSSAANAGNAANVANAAYAAYTAAYAAYTANAAANAAYTAAYAANAGDAANAANAAYTAAVEAINYNKEITPFLLTCYKKALKVKE